MSSNAALTLDGEDLLPTVKVRASAVFSILSNFVRRGEKQARVIGTLMGCVNEGNVVEVTICLYMHISLCYYLQVVIFACLCRLLSFSIPLSNPSLPHTLSFFNKSLFNQSIGERLDFNLVFLLLHTDNRLLWGTS